MYICMYHLLILTSLVSCIPVLIRQVGSLRTSRIAQHFNTTQDDLVPWVLSHGAWGYGSRDSMMFSHSIRICNLFIDKHTITEETCKLETPVLVSPVVSNNTKESTAGASILSTDPGASCTKSRRREAINFLARRSVLDSSLPHNGACQHCDRETRQPPNPSQDRG
jgi:hypothetical protein